MTARARKLVELTRLYHPIINDNSGQYPFAIVLQCLRELDELQEQLDWRELNYVEEQLEYKE